MTAKEKFEKDILTAKSVELGDVMVAMDGDQVYVFSNPDVDIYDMWVFDTPMMRHNIILAQNILGAMGEENSVSIEDRMYFSKFMCNALDDDGIIQAVLRLWNGGFLDELHEHYGSGVTVSTYEDDSEPKDYTEVCKLTEEQSAAVDEFVAAYNKAMSLGVGMMRDDICHMCFFNNNNVDIISAEDESYDDNCIVPSDMTQYMRKEQMDTDFYDDSWYAMMIK